jgi:hypothetical protein
VKGQVETAVMPNGIGRIGSAAMARKARFFMCRPIERPFV